MKAIKDPRLQALLDQMLYSGTSFGLSLALAALHSLEDVGRYGAVMLLAYLLASLGGALLIQPFQVSWPRCGALGPYLASVAFAQVVYVAGVLLVGGLLLRIPALQQAGWRMEMLALVAAFLLHDAARKLLLVRERLDSLLRLDAAIAAGQFLALLASAWWRLDIASTCAVLALGCLPGLAGAWAALRPQWSRRRGGTYMRLHLRQGRWLLATALLQWWSGNLFAVASGPLLGHEALGVLRLLQTVFGVLNLLLQALENYALPRAVAHHARDGRAAAAYIRSNAALLWLVFGPFLLGILLFGDLVLLACGGPSWLVHADVLRGMVVLYLVVALAHPVRMALRTLVLNQAFFLGYLLAFVFSLATFQVLLATWGLLGCIIGLIANQVIMLLCWSIVLHTQHFPLWRSSTSYSAKPTPNA